MVLYLSKIVYVMAVLTRLCQILVNELVAFALYWAFIV